MSAPKLLDRLHAKQTELLEMERRSRSTPDLDSVSQNYETELPRTIGKDGKSDRQRDRIRRLARDVTPAELLAAHATIKPTLKKQPTSGDLQELALTLAVAAKKTEPNEYRPARTLDAGETYRTHQKENHANRN